MGGGIKGGTNFLQNIINGRESRILLKNDKKEQEKGTKT